MLKKLQKYQDSAVTAKRIPLERVNPIVNGVWGPWVASQSSGRIVRAKWITLDFRQSQPCCQCCLGTLGSIMDFCQKCESQAGPFRFQTESTLLSMVFRDISQLHSLLSEVWQPSGSLQTESTLLSMVSSGLGQHHSLLSVMVDSSELLLIIKIFFNQRLLAVFITIP